jgi:hypothetical protein
MTVKQLIARLKKLDQNATIGFRDHDADEYTISSWVNGAFELDFDEIPERQKAENIWNETGIIVILHP